MAEVHKWTNTYDAQKKMWFKNKNNMFNLILQHCTSDMKAKLQYMDDWKSEEIDQ